MKRFTPTVQAMILTMLISSTALAGHIAVGRTAGNIPGGRAAGNIAGGRAAGNIAGGRAATLGGPSNNPALMNHNARIDFEAAISGTFAGLLRMLLESGALL
jgi:hypothetical protein